MTTAIAKMGWSLTVEDLLLLELPHMAPADRVFVLWEFTGWPEFWPSHHRCEHCAHRCVADHPVVQLRNELRQFRSASPITAPDEG